MRTWILIAILLVPLAAADGWYYSGDTWESGGILYSVDGNDPNTVLIGVDERLLLIPLYSCVELGNSEYCYTKTAYPDDDTHIKYEAGEKLYAFYITVQTFEPEITTTRSVIQPDDVKEYADVEITIANEGDFRVTNVQYRIAVPAGIKVLQGTKVGSDIVFKENVLAVGQQTKFRYRVLPEQYGSFAFDPNLTYEYEGKQYYIDPKDWTLTLADPIDVELETPKTLEIDELGTASITITNDGDEDIPVKVFLYAPEHAEIVSVDGLNSEMSSSFELMKDEEEEISFDFYTTGSTTFKWFVNFTSGTYESDEVYSQSVGTAEDYVDAEIRVFPAKGPYYSGFPLNISGILENLNDKVRFKNVKGEMTSDLFRTIPFKHESIGPTIERTEAEAIITTPNVDETTTYDIKFTGTYESPRGRKYTFSETKSVTIVPFVRSVEIKHEWTPAKPLPGGNVTVTVTAKNVEGTYLTFDAHDKFSNDIVKSGGLSYAEASLERDASQKLYTYKLDIPEGYEKESFTVTTVVLVKDDILTEETVKEIPLGVPAGTVVAPDVEEETDTVVDADTNVDEKEPGFLGKMWTGVKGVFSDIGSFFGGLFSKDDAEEIGEES